MVQLVALAVVQDEPPGMAVAVYPVRVPVSRLAGPVQDTVAVALPGTAVTAAGACGPASSAGPPGRTCAALAAMDAAGADVGQTRRLLKAAASGRRPRGTTSPAARPGQRRDLVAAHLAANPDGEFSPHATGRVLGRSSGAVANALDRLTALGRAHLTSEKPRRYRHQAPASTPAPTT